MLRKIIQESLGGFDGGNEGVDPEYDYDDDELSPGFSDSRRDREDPYGRIDHNDPSDDAQQMHKSILKSSGVELDTITYSDEEPVPLDGYLGKITQEDADKLGTGGVRSIVRTLNKKFPGEDLTTFMPRNQGAFSSEGTYIEFDDVFFGRGNFKIVFRGGH